MKKKCLLVLMMCTMMLFPVFGCNKEKVEGVYTFDKIEIYESKDTRNDPYKVLTCSQTDMNDEIFGKELCGRDGKVKNYKFDIQDEDTIRITMDGDEEEFYYEIGDGGVMIIESVSSQKDPVLIYKDGKIILAVEFQAEVPGGTSGDFATTISGTFTVHAIFSR